MTGIHIAAVGRRPRQDAVVRRVLPRRRRTAAACGAAAACRSRALWRWPTSPSPSTPSRPSSRSPATRWSSWWPTPPRWSVCASCTSCSRPCGPLRVSAPRPGAVLVVVGAKMALADVYHLPAWASQLVVIGILAAAITASLRVTPASPPRKAALVNLTPESIRAIDAIADPVGVLSLYGDGPRRRRAACRSRPGAAPPAAARRGGPAGGRRRRRRRPLPPLAAAHRVPAVPAGARVVARRRRVPAAQLGAVPPRATCRCRSASSPPRADRPRDAAGRRARRGPAGRRRRRPPSSVQVLEWRQGRIDQSSNCPSPAGPAAPTAIAWEDFRGVGRGYRIDAVAEGCAGWSRSVAGGACDRGRPAAPRGGGLRPPAAPDVEVRTLAAGPRVCPRPTWPQRRRRLGRRAAAVRVAAGRAGARRRPLDQSAVLGADAVVAALELGLVEHLVIDPSRVGRTRRRRARRLLSGWPSWRSPPVPRSRRSRAPAHGWPTWEAWPRCSLSDRRRGSAAGPVLHLDQVPPASGRLPSTSVKPYSRASPPDESERRFQRRATSGSAASATTARPMKRGCLGDARSGAIRSASRRASCPR